MANLILLRIADVSNHIIIFAFDLLTDINDRGLALFPFLAPWQAELPRSVSYLDEMPHSLRRLPPRGDLPPGASRAGRCAAACAGNTYRYVPRMRVYTCWHYSAA